MAPGVLKASSPTTNPQSRGEWDTVRTGVQTEPDAGSTRVCVYARATPPRLLLGVAWALAVATLGTDHLVAHLRSSALLARAVGRV